MLHLSHFSHQVSLLNLKVREVLPLPQFDKTSSNLEFDRKPPPAPSYPVGLVVVHLPSQVSVQVSTEFSISRSPASLIRSTTVPSPPAPITPHPGRA